MATRFHPLIQRLLTALSAVMTSLGMPSGQEPPLRELPWLRICHVLLQCESPAQLVRVDALFGFCDSMDLLPGLPPACATLTHVHVRLLTRCLRAVCCAGAPSPAWLFLLQDWLLQFQPAPTEWMHPPRFAWPQLARLAAQLLRGDPPVASCRPAPDREPWGDLACTRRTVAARIVHMGAAQALMHAAAS
jgi:hypothetical protein